MLFGFLVFLALLSFWMSVVLGVYLLVTHFACCSVNSSLVYSTPSMTQVSPALTNPMVWFYRLVGVTLPLLLPVGLSSAFLFGIQEHRLLFTTEQEELLVFTVKIRSRLAI